jgi:hypothetical protein
MSYQIFNSELQKLGFDLQAAVAAHRQAILDHRLTVDIPAPTAHPLVEEIVRHHNAQITVMPDPPAPPQPPAPPPEPPVAVISFAQMLIALVQLGWITESEGEGWLNFTLPPVVLGLINELPEEQRFGARVRALRPSQVWRNDPLVNALAEQEDKTPEEVEQFFAFAATL